MNIFRSAFLILTLLSYSYKSLGQITVSDTMSLANLIQSLVGDGVQVSNITSNGGSYGQFANGSASIKLTNGLIMTTGEINNALGPNDDAGTSGSTGTFGDSDLEALIGASTLDATVIEFDLVPTADIISFKYVFASEEYPEFVCSGSGSSTTFNDAFAFLVSGPGITGQKNIALLPSTGTAVSISSVNAGDPTDPNCHPNNFKYFVPNYTSTAGPNFNPQIQYDGYTVPLEAEIAVTPCQTYHFKLVIADVVDAQYDSGVFLESGSLKSFKAEIVPISFYDRWIYGIEGCNDGGFIFTRDYAMSDTIVLKYLLKGSAENGVDYTFVQDSIVIPAFEDTVSLTISPLTDAVDDPFENVVLYLIDQCTGLPDYSDSAVFEIREKFTHDVPDEKVCQGNSVQLNTSYTLNVDVFNWTPPDDLSCTDCVMPFSSPDSTFEYYVTLLDTVTGCDGYDTMTVEVYNYPQSTINLISDTLNTICLGDTNLINVTGHTNIGGVSYEWLANPEVIPINDSTANIFPDSSTYIYARVFNDLGCPTLDSLYINVSRKAYFEITNPPLLCFGSTVLVGPDTLPEGNYIYEWSGNGTINPMDSAYTYITPPSSGSYDYTLTAYSAEDFCDFSNKVSIATDPELVADFFFDCQDFIAPLNLNFENKTIAGHTFNWSLLNVDSSLIETQNDFNANFNFTDVGDYIVKLHVVGADSSCQDSVFANISTSTFEIYNVFTPNGDGINDVFYIEGIKPGYMHLEVYNRWGERVYYSEAYNNDWDGQGATDGVYYYYFKNPYRDEKIKGWVTILR